LSALFSKSAGNFTPERASTATEFKVDPAVPAKSGQTGSDRSPEQRARRQGTWQSQPCFHAVNDKVPPHRDRLNF